jgi:hypothetical protein
VASADWLGIWLPAWNPDWNRLGREKAAKSMKPKRAGSLVLASLNALILASALAVGYSGLSPWWAAVSLWIIPVPLVLFTAAYLVAVKAGTRKQALMAAAILVPTAALEWSFKFRGI